MMNLTCSEALLINVSLIVAHINQKELKYGGGKEKEVEMQAKFINIFGQWVHPDFNIFVETLDIEGEKKDHVLLQHSTDAPDIWFCRFENKTIDEVAEEYNRQVDIENRGKYFLHEKTCKCSCGRLEKL